MQGPPLEGQTALALNVPGHAPAPTTAGPLTQSPPKTSAAVQQGPGAGGGLLHVPVASQTEPAAPWLPKPPHDPFAQVHTALVPLPMEQHTGLAKSVVVVAVVPAVVVVVKPPPSIVGVVVVEPPPQMAVTLPVGGEPPPSVVT